MTKSQGLVQSEELGKLEKFIHLIVSPTRDPRLQHSASPTWALIKSVSWQEDIWGGREAYSFAILNLWHPMCRSLWGGPWAGLDAMQNIKKPVPAGNRAPVV
jgi:hypothetical protein